MEEGEFGGEDGGAGDGLARRGGGVCRWQIWIIDWRLSCAVLLLN